MPDQAVIKTKPVVHARGEGSAYWMLGGLYEERLTAAETGGELTLMEFTIPVGMGPPPHIHAQDEVVYILEGTANYHLDGTATTVGPGSVIFIPKGAKETFEPTTTLRMLSMYLPGGADRFFAEAGEPAPRREPPPAPTSPPDVERLTAIASKYGLQLLPPGS
ncbi:MAG TPA: cupin domain-containing protein [Candidatus Dormibacteraeota bacterium]|jgi:quercetin dioxygenase-like cupin family protein|nr:cupin domain-containing protein [Candidatus Dormibacteraeota bacterium]